MVKCSFLIWLKLEKHTLFLPFIQNGYMNIMNHFKKDEDISLAVTIVEGKCELFWVKFSINSKVGFLNAYMAR